jgi:hypothetical protein
LFRPQNDATRQRTVARVRSIAVGVAASTGARATGRWWTSPRLSATWSIAVSRLRRGARTRTVGPWT